MVIWRGPGSMHCSRCSWLPRSHVTSCGFAERGRVGARHWRARCQVTRVRGRCASGTPRFGSSYVVPGGRNWLFMRSISGTIWSFQAAHFDLGRRRGTVASRDLGRPAVEAELQVALAPGQQPSGERVAREVRQAQIGAVGAWRSRQSSALSPRRPCCGRRARAGYTPPRRRRARELGNSSGRRAAQRDRRAPRPLRLRSRPTDRGTRRAADRSSRRAAASFAPGTVPRDQKKYRGAAASVNADRAARGAALTSYDDRVMRLTPIRTGGGRCIRATAARSTGIRTTSVFTDPYPCSGGAEACSANEARFLRGETRFGEEAGLVDRETYISGRGACSS